MSNNVKRMLVACTIVAAAATMAHAADGVKFTLKQLTVDANEGCVVADVDRDGKPDVIAGRNWYAAPEFVPRPLRQIDDWNGYVQSNGDHAWDVNGDGWIDVIAGSFLPTELHWYQNPGPEGLVKGQLWQQHLLVDTASSQNEGTYMHDIDGDGAPEIIVNSWNPKNPLTAWKLVKQGAPGTYKVEPRTLGRSNNSHGLGFGDVNNDGREDILVGTGWYERPQGDPYITDWVFHGDWQVAGAGSPIAVRDLDGDGRNDIIWGKGHDYGLFWWQAQRPAGAGAPTWKEHRIDGDYSQNHSFAWADVDGDGSEEMITGKRKWAHNGKDPGGSDAPCLYYYKWDGQAQRFERFTINEGQVGTGLQIRTADMNEDGRIDIIVAGKSGTYILFNQRP